MELRRQKAEFSVDKTAVMFRLDKWRKLQRHTAPETSSETDQVSGGSEGKRNSI